MMDFVLPLVGFFIFYFALALTGWLILTWPYGARKAVTVNAVLFLPFVLSEAIFFYLALSQSWRDYNGQCHILLSGGQTYSCSFGTYFTDSWAFGALLRFPFAFFGFVTLVFLVTIMRFVQQYNDRGRRTADGQHPPV